MKSCLSGNGRIGVPVLPRHAQAYHFHHGQRWKLGRRKEEAMEEAKQAIDEILAPAYLAKDSELGHTRH